MNPASSRMKRARCVRSSALIDDVVPIGSLTCASDRAIDQSVVRIARRRVRSRRWGTDGEVRAGSRIPHHGFAGWKRRGLGQRRVAVQMGIAFWIGVTRDGKPIDHPEPTGCIEYGATTVDDVKNWTFSPCQRSPEKHRRCNRASYCKSSHCELQSWIWALIDLISLPPSKCEIEPCAYEKSGKDRPEPPVMAERERVPSKAGKESKVFAIVVSSRAGRGREPGCDSDRVIFPTAREDLRPAHFAWTDGLTVQRRVLRAGAASTPGEVSSLST